MQSIVYNIDCMDGMKQYPDKHFDLAVVDPPYGLPERSGKGAGKLQNRIIQQMHQKGWDIAPDLNYFTELFRVSKNTIVWGGNYFNLPPTRGFIIWDKEQPFPNFSDCEFAWTSYDKVAKIYRQATTRTGEVKIHPTQKPIALYDWIYHHYLPNGGRVLNTHLGSGSNRIAAHKRGNIDFTGYELDKDYFEAAEKRFLIHARQQTMQFT